MNEMTPLDLVAHGRLVTLRRKRPGDARREYEWQCDAELARFDGRAPLDTSFEDYARSYRALLEFPPGDAIHLAIEEQGAGHVGHLAFYNIQRASAELGITLGYTSARGRGLGPDAICTALRWGWHSLQLRNVYLHTLEWNERARSCFERCGFRAAARVQRPAGEMVRYEAQREWWAMEDAIEPYPRASSVRS
jgi:RimJ/RimL family protein N-acetyltransferase